VSDAVVVWDEGAAAVFVVAGDAGQPPGAANWPLVARSTEPTAADYGTEVVPVGAVWVVTA
jgi:hypothetical protein